MAETEDWLNINLVVESRPVKIDREISKNEVVEELINIRMGVEKYSVLIAGSEICRKDRNQTDGPRSTRWLGVSVQNVVSTVQQAECLQKLEVSPCMEAPDIWEEWWHPACVLAMLKDMWSTRCRRACVRSHAKRHTGCHQPEADWFLPSSVKSVILYDCEAEALSNLIRPSQSYSPTIKWRCCPRLVQFHGFRSVEVLLDTPPGNLKNCPEAKGCSVQVQISPSRPVSVYMIKPRVFPSQDQSSPVPVIFKDSVVAGGRTIWVPTLSPKSGLGTGFGLVCIWFPLLEARSWQEAKSNLVMVALGKDDQIAWCWTLGPPESWSKFCDFDRIVPSPSRSASGTWCWVGRDENLRVEGVRGQTQTRSERGETNTENWSAVWIGHMVRNKTSLGMDFISSWEDEDREGFEESRQG
ncbi:hypothetical protein F2Q68_00033697 [Brassica cretica]|uniref:Uncharacterized protein n=2 Tax=Brassica cretica TaxID=69181 RepID=A0A3N6RT90_BRACR|nr:hypothetical protein F2Q68_00033697 [Brassica cretica]KAF3534511.1 hypothetical protein DY000_02042669 [Brassica cretica]